MRLRSLFAVCFTATALAAFAQDTPAPTAPPAGAPGAGMRGQGMRQRQPRLNGEIIAVTADSITVKSVRRAMNFQGNRGPGGAVTPANPTTPATPGTAVAPQPAETVTTHTVKTNPQTTYTNLQRQPITRAELKVGATVMVQYLADATAAPAAPPAAGATGGNRAPRAMFAAPAVVTAQSITVMPPTISGTLVGATATAVTIRDAAGKYQVYTITPTTVVTNNGVVAKATELKTNTQTFVTVQDKNALQIYQGTPPRGGFGAFGGMRGQNNMGGVIGTPGATRQGQRGNRGARQDSGNSIAPPIDSGSVE